jgi:hypothetical protein
MTLGVFVYGPAMADAHPGHGGDRVVVESVRPHLPGVRVQPVPGGTGRLSLASTRVPVAVLGTGGQPMFRVGPQGVEANAASPDWYRNNEPLGIAEVPAEAAPTARPRWVRVSTASAWRWFDHRLHPTGRPTAGGWSIPLRAGRRRAVVRGRVAPVGGSFTVRVDDERPLPGVEVRGVTQPVSVTVSSTGRRPVEVLGPRGELWARIGPEGAAVNVRSAAWPAAAQYANRDLLAYPPADPGAPPRMVPFSRARDLTWPDPRLIGAGDLPAVPAPDERPRDLRRWSIELRSGGRNAVVGGVTALGPPQSEAAPPSLATPTAAAPRTGEDGGADWGTIALTALAAAALVGGALLLRRR